MWQFQARLVGPRRQHDAAAANFLIAAVSEELRCSGEQKKAKLHHPGKKPSFCLYIVDYYLARLSTNPESTNGECKFRFLFSPDMSITHSVMPLRNKEEEIGLRT